jgi:hypothetical protein
VVVGAAEATLRCVVELDEVVTTITVAMTAIAAAAPIPANSRERVMVHSFLSPGSVVRVD